MVNIDKLNGGYNTFGNMNYGLSGITPSEYFIRYPNNDVFGFIAPYGVMIPFNDYYIVDTNDSHKFGISTSTKCELSVENKREIRKQMKANEKKSYNEKERIVIKFGYNCDKSSGENAVINYRDKIRPLIKEFGKLKTGSDERIAFNPNDLTDWRIKKSTQDTYGEWEDLKKYNKIGGSNITKINVFINDNEYKEVPYLGSISDEYHKKLFRGSFDIFPTKQLNN